MGVGKVFLSLGYHTIRAACTKRKTLIILTKTYVDLTIMLLLFSIKMFTCFIMSLNKKQF